ncbi:MAG: phosphodiester glycosidase family protein, partial [Anaerotignaceae bacterium]
TDVEGTANFDYFKSTMHFYADGQMHFELAGVNTVTKLEYPVYLDRNFANDTSSLDARFTGLAKIVVENGVITKISQKGEVVQIPENGFIIIMDSINADAHLQYFAVGQKGEFKIYANFDMDKIDTAISGGGVILKNGSKPADYGEMSSGRHPRTLLGLSQDGKTMKLIVADGQRSNGSNVSIGLNVDEAVGLLMAEGMYNGLNLDGGGSSIMAVKNADKDTVTTVSSPAEGSERNIMTAVGVFDDSQPGQIIDLVIKPALTRTVEGGKVNFEVFGHDENYHKINVPINEVVFDWDTEKGTINGNVYTAIGTGKNFISATYNGLVATATVDVSPIIALKANQKSITLNEGENFTIDVSGTTVDGYTASLNGSLVIEPTLGTVSGNVYTATEKGAGYIKCSYGGLSTYIKVVVGTDEKLISSFENSPELNFTAFP